MDKATYFIRCDSSSVIGSGHVMRCINLARQLSPKNIDVIFLCRDLPGNVYQRIEKAGYRAILIPIQPGDTDYSISQQEDADAIIGIIQTYPAPTLIVDHYALNSEWQKKVKQHARLVVIDDLADRPHNCDAVINQNYYPQGVALYSGLIPPDADVWIGPSYAMLSATFTACRKNICAQTDGTKRRVVIFFGAGDPSNLTKTATIAAIESQQFDKIDVVAGPNHPDIASLVQIVEKHQNVHLHSFIDNFAEFLLNAGLMIGAGGTTQLERCCLGIPGLVISIADNQRIVSQNLHDKGCAVYLGWYETVTQKHILNAINELYSDPTRMGEMTASCLQLTDGCGAGRLATLLTIPTITLRAARIEDGATMHSWRNHPAVRQYSGNPDEIPLADHLSWLEKTLLNKNTALLIAASAGTDFGVLRFDIKEEIALVSVYLNPQSIGQGMGYGLLEIGKQWVQKHYPQIKFLHAAIHDDNARSLRTFSKAGYIKRHDIYELEL